MTGRTITVEHGGKTYAGEIMRIAGTSLGYEDHGILSAFLHCESNGGGIGVGGYALDTAESLTSDRRGTAFGLDHVIQIMRTVGVSSWEKLVGQDVIILYAGSSGWGGRSVGIASLLGDEVLIFEDHAKSFRPKAEADAR